MKNKTVMKNKILIEIKEGIKDRETHVNNTVSEELNKGISEFMTLEIYENLLLFIRFTKEYDRYIVDENDYFLMDKNNNIYFFDKSNKKNVLSGFLNSKNAPFYVSDIKYILVNGQLSSTTGYHNDIDGVAYIEDIFQEFVGDDIFFIKGNGEIYSRRKLRVNNLSYFLKEPKTLSFTSKKKQKEIDNLTQSNYLTELSKSELDRLFEDSLALYYSNVSAATYFDILDDYIVLRYFAFDQRRSLKLKSGEESKKHYKHKEYMRIYIDSKGLIISHNVNNKWTYNKSNMRTMYLFAGYNSNDFLNLKNTTNNRVSYLGALLKGIDNIAGPGRDSSLSNGLTVLLYTLRYPFIEQLFKLGFNVNSFINDIYKQTKSFSSKTKLDDDISSYAFAKLRIKEPNSIYKVFNMTKDQINYLIKKEDFDFFTGDTNDVNNLRIGNLTKYDFISYLSHNSISDLGLENFIYAYEVLEKYINSPEKVRMYSRSFLLLRNEDFKIRDFEKILDLFNEIYSKQDVLFEDNNHYLACSLMSKIIDANDKSITMVESGDLYKPLYKSIVEVDIELVEPKTNEIIQYYKDIMENNDDPFQSTKEVALSLEFKDRQYSIIRAENFKDFKKESDSLNHCLYSTYRDSAYRGDSIILFMRHNNELSTPLYTIEVVNTNNVLRVTQVKGVNNSSIQKPSEKNFLKHWKSVKGIN